MIVTSLRDNKNEAIRALANWLRSVIARYFISRKSKDISFFCCEMFISKNDLHLRDIVTAANLGIMIVVNILILVNRRLIVI